MPGTDDQETSTNEPEEPDQDREDCSTRKKLVTALVQAACTVITSALGQVAGDALSSMMGLV
ncbi:hypothetical protein [Streptomyces sp. NPDC003514]